MTSIEHQQIKGITVKNVIVTLISTISIVVSVMTSYFQLKGDIRDIKSEQSIQTRVSDLRLRIIEERVSLIQQQVDELKKEKR